MKVIKVLKDSEGEDIGYGVEELPSDESPVSLPSVNKPSRKQSVPVSDKTEKGKPKAPASEKSVLSRLQTQCSKREYCRKDIYQKALKGMEGDSEAAGRIVAALVKERYVDDLRYASAFAREKASLSGWGKVKISYMLSAKGIDKAIIGEALSEIDEDSSAKKMESVLRSKFRSLEGEKDAYLKLLRFALTRGYNYDEAKEVVDSIIKEWKESLDGDGSPKKEEW